MAGPPSLRPPVRWCRGSPWVPRSWTTAPPDGVAFSAKELAEEVALLRAKRIQEGILFYGENTASIARPAWEMTERTIRGVYAPKAVSLNYTGYEGSPTDASEIAKIEDTLHVDGTQSAISIKSSFTGTEHRAEAFVNFDDCFRAPAATPGLKRLVDDGYDFLVYVEASIHHGVSTDDSPPVGHDLNARVGVSCTRMDNTSVQLASFDGEGAISVSRNEFGVIRCAWEVPSSQRDQPAHRLDPSRITIRATNTEQELYVGFHLKIDLVQVIPYKSGGAAIVGASCSPAVDLVTNANMNTPVSVDGLMFQDSGPTGGFRVAWSAPIFAQVPSFLVEPNEPPPTPRHYVRIYRYMGNTPNPLADVTCSTDQMLIVTGSVTHPNSGTHVYIKYRPDGVLQSMPKGLYKFCTYTCATDLQGGCRGIIYPRLRTAMAGPLEGEAPVSTGSFWVEVAGPVITTRTIRPEMCHGECVADFDDGSGTGTPDGGVTIDDLLYYLILFEAGDICADVDDGSGTGTQDDGVTIDDLLYYLGRFEQGC